MVETLGDEFGFMVLTSDRDFRSSGPFEGIPSGKWLSVGKAKVMYLSRKGLSVLNIFRLLHDLEYDLLYLNGFFPRRFSILPCFLKWLGVLPGISILLAPRGEFSKGAINIKYWRKKIYLSLSKIIGIYDGIHWHASSEFEREDIMREFGNCFNISLASPVSDYNIYKLYGRKEERRILDAMDILGSALSLHHHNREMKRTGFVRFCFLSRISPKKNLDFGIELLDGLKGNIQYHIYGPIEDVSYWNRCEKRINKSSANVTIEYKGEVRHDQVGELFVLYDFFLFPTRGENFGHVIVESLLTGCPVIISDQTPWRNLEACGAGWDLPLEDRDAFREVLQRCIDMDADEYANLSMSAREYAENRCMDSGVLEQNRNLFTKALGVSS